MNQPADDAVYYRAAGLVDVIAGEFRPDAGLLIRSGRIAAVGTPDEVTLAGVDSVDLRPAVLVPGFIDAHTHVTIRPGEGDQHAQLQGPPAWQAVRGVQNLNRMVRSGVTTARIMTEEHDIDVHFKTAVAAGEVTGPRLRVAGRGLSPSGKHGSAAGGVDGPEQIRAAIAANAAKGADHIKIFTTGGVSSTNTSLEESNYSAEDIETIVEAAGGHGLTVSAHAHGGPGVDLAMNAGVRSVEHGALLTERNISSIQAAGAWLVLTNSILFHPSGIEQGDAAEPAIMQKVLQARASTAALAERIRAAGIPLALGTDSMHGLFGYEMRWMVDNGWSTGDALAAATIQAARLFGVDDIGALEPGRRADFVALRGNPLEDIDAVGRIAGVYQDGRQVAGADDFVRPALPASQDRS